MRSRHHTRLRGAALALVVSLSSTSAWAQTRIVAPPNKYSTRDDIRLGREAAAQVRRELPLLNDSRVDGYVEAVGRRLVGGIPPSFRHSGFRYSFDVVNMREINAFALPGGPMYVNRGTLEAARNEGELAGVIAHELGHVVLRHGTAQATKGQKFQIGAIAGQILGAIVGGTAGNVIAQGSNIGLGTYFMKYSREYERQADLLGAQIMARAGYDPRHMANMFRTIQQRGGGGGGPEWLSSHPNPGNRYDAIAREARSLRVRGSAGSSGQFSAVKARLQRMPPAYTAQQVARR
jgi:predicted Zn-dependent protease